MITNIKLANFRAFQDEISVRIRPITVLIGRNSAGKSSLLKFLLMLRQTLESQGDSFFATDGGHVQLGTWLDLRNTQTRSLRQREDYCRFDVTVETDDLPPPEIQAMWKATSRGGVVSSDSDRLRITLEVPRQPIHARAKKAEFNIGGTVRYGSKFRYGRHVVDGRLEGELIFKKRADNLAKVGFLRFAERTDSLNKLLEGVVSERFLDSLRQEFLTPRHLSPVREESQRAVQTGSPPPRDVGHRGEYAMPHLARILTDPEERMRAKFIVKHAAAVARLDKVIFSRRLATLVTHIKARNMDTQAVCSLADFGFGVSQCLPIFIQGTMHFPGQLLVVEQPEAQLHPTAQLEMGSFFAELWNEKKVPSLIETHSANILLRLRKLISKGDLKAEDISVAFFTLDSIAGKRGGAHTAVVVKNLDVNPDGSLEKGLPMEFFGGDILEALEFGRESQ
jgi:energy-coupling factor transporter ATP-binding protein EcfA2